jgi:hypothetical protein
LAGTKTYGITYSNSPEAGNLFYGYTDTAYANADDIKSTLGYVYLMAGGAVTWRSKKQTMITMSSTEAEYDMPSEAGHEACWLRNLYTELGFPQKEPTVLNGDNNRSITMAHNPQFHKCTKHIEI